MHKWIRSAIIFQSLLTQRVAFLLQVQWDGEEAASQRAKRVENLLIRMTLDGLPSTCIGNAIYRDWSRRPVLTVVRTAIADYLMGTHWCSETGSRLAEGAT
eukprot:Em0004g1707a